MEWTYLIFGVILFHIVKMLVLVVDREIKERREKRFLKMVLITFPESSDIRLISVSGSDKQSLEKLERQLRHYHWRLKDD